MRRVVALVFYFSILNIISSQMDSGTEKLLKDRKSANTSKDTIWKMGGVISVNFSQVYLSNWAGGGQNAVSSQGLVSLYANYAKKKFTWDNTLDMAYGVIKQGKAKSTPWFKNDDRLEFNTKIGHKASKQWYYSGLANFRTQFNDGYNKVGDTVHISNFMAPAYVITALGMDFKPNKNLTLFIAPATGKLTFVLDDYLSGIGAFGVDSNEVFRSEIGGYLKFAYTKEKPFKMEGVTFKTNLTLFSNYMNEPGNIDVTWETYSTIKLNKYLNMSISTYLLYDHDVDIARYNSDGTVRYYKDVDGNNIIGDEGEFIQVKGPVTQFKEAWSLGFAYKF